MGKLVILVVLHDNFNYLMLSLLIRANNVAVHQEKAQITLDISSVQVCCPHESSIPWSNIQGHHSIKTENEHVHIFRVVFRCLL